MAVRRYGFVAGLGALILALDQITKVWVLGALSAARPAIEVTSFLNIVLVWNRGISFGLFNRESDWQPWLLVGLSLVIVAGLLLWLRTERGRWMTLAIALLAGGAIGNAVDRVRLGAVVDFLDFHVRGWHFAAFNVADAAITCGVAVLLVGSLFGSRNDAT
ncbi:MAG: signal peptidase II [Rhodospirillaceae bacterium]|nr:signal peptidase II [Rhodospirillaceae bacterium]MDE0616581.1 signal peptidase II [Rhodospirillaceae bacterium]